MLHWRDVTPPGSAHGNFAGDHPIFEQASFLDANTGWVTAWDIGDVRVTLYRTSDGGSHWTHAPSGGHSANAGAAERFQLLDARTAYRLSLEPTGPGVNLAVTKDAGEHWATVYDGRTGHGQGPGVEPMTFASEERGFATDVLTLADYSYEATGQLSTTIDGGHTWSTSHPPLAGSRPCSQGVPPTCVLASPTFFDQADGVLPGATREGTKTTISFDQTANAGSTWTLAGHLTVPDPRAPGSQRCGATCALASIAGAADWWVISRSAGRLRTWRTTDAGSTWSRTSAVAVHGRPTSLWAVSATVAWAVVETSVPQGTTRELMVTRDGGVTWHVVRPLRPGD